MNETEQAIDHLARAQGDGVKAGIHSDRFDMAQASITMGYSYVALASVPGC